MMSSKRKIVFSLILLVLGLLLVCSFAEWGLRFQQRKVASSGVLDPGLFRHESQLGWELVPNWEGRHRHHDYDVDYRVNRLGFRADTGAAEVRPKPLIAVLGDSFTFGFGVADDQTFVHVLDREIRPGGCVVNFAVPGTSTDQQALLLERRLLKFRPAVVLLVVYLGNDLVDNLRPYPAQASNPKPFFELGPDGLALRNVPVPEESRKVVNAQGTLRQAILGEETTTSTGTGSRSALVQRLVRNKEVDYREAIEAQIDQSLLVFQAIADRVAKVCGDHGVELKFALLAGRSYLEQPDSLSAQYQDIGRSRIVDWARNRDLQVIDVAQTMREQGGNGQRGWYFPNEGHLTPEGHRVVAEILRSEISDR